jgi:hypothetical protein
MLAGLTLFLLNNSNLDEITGSEKVRIEEINIPCSVIFSFFKYHSEPNVFLFISLFGKAKK